MAACFLIIQPSFPPLTLSHQRAPQEVSVDVHWFVFFFFFHLQRVQVTQSKQSNRCDSHLNSCVLRKTTPVSLLSSLNSLLFTVLEYFLTLKELLE